MNFSRFFAFSAITGRQSEKIRSRCAVFRQFPSFHTVWVIGGCPRQVDGTVGVPSAPEIPCPRRQLRLAPEIGIGGHLAVPPLPHHRAYGSRTTAVRLG